MARLLGERAAQDQPAKRASRPQRRRARHAIAAGLMAALVIAGAVLLTARQTASAVDVRHAAAAAREAGTFRFTTTSDLRTAGGAQLSTATGAVDLGHPAYRVRVTGTASGFERILFPDTLYVRHIARTRATPWREIPLAPPAKIAPAIGGASGIADPLAVLVVLHDSSAAEPIGTARIGAAEATGFRIRSTLSEFLRAEGVSPPPRSATSPVVIEAWLDRHSRLVRARRTFTFSAPGGPAQLRITTDFAGYGRPLTLRAPRPALRAPVHIRLDPVAEEPLTASVLRALLFGSRHPAAPTVDEGVHR